MGILSLSSGFLGYWGLIAFALVVGIVGFAFFMIKKYRDEVAPKKQVARNNHDRGMKAVKKVLGAYIRRSDGRVIYDIEVGSKRTKGSADAILIGYFGVLVLVCCALSGELFANDKDERLTQIVKQERRQYDNPVLQATTAAKAVAELLREKKVYKVPVESAVIFTNKKASPNVPASLKSYRLKALRKALKSDRFLEDKGVDTDAAAEAILSWR